MHETKDYMSVYRRYRFGSSHKRAYGCNYKYKLGGCESKQ